MTIRPTTTPAPRYPLLTAAIAGAAALTLSACTCNECKGSGLQFITPSGRVPWSAELNQSENKPRMGSCIKCQGVGTTNLWGQPQDAFQHVVGAIPSSELRLID